MIQKNAEIRKNDMAIYSDIWYNENANEVGSNKNLITHHIDRKLELSGNDRKRLVKNEVVR